MIRLAVIGTGFGRYCIVPAFRRTDRFQITMLCSSNRRSAEEYVRTLEIPKATDDWHIAVSSPNVDAVAIATPPTLQTEIALAALENGKAVFTEKPLAVSLADAEVLAARASASGLANMIDFIFPELDTWKLAEAAIRNGRLGQVRHVAVDWHMESYDNARRIKSWKTDASRGGGVLRHFLSHSLYYLEWLLGPLEAVRASLFSAPDLGNEGETDAALAFRFANGASGSLSASNAAPFGLGHRVQIYGSDGTLTLQNGTPKTVEGFVYSRWTRTGGLEEVHHEPDYSLGEGLDERIQPVSRLARRFADWIEKGSSTTPTLTQGLRVQELIAAAQHSSDEGEWTDVTLMSR